MVITLLLRGDILKKSNGYLQRKFLKNSIAHIFKEKNYRILLFTINITCLLCRKQKWNLRGNITSKLIITMLFINLLLHNTSKMKLEDKEIRRSNKNGNFIL